MDLDDELFSLAAGRNKSSSKKRSRKAAESDEEEYIESDVDSEEEAPKRKRASKGGKPKKQAEDEEKEDDADEYDSDDPEGLFENEEDRRKLMAMTERDREMILFERAERRDNERQRMQLLQQQRAATEKAGKGKGGDKDGGKGKGKGAEGRAVPRSRAARTAAAARTARDWSDEDASDGGGKSEDEEEEFQPSGSSSEEEEEEEGAAAGQASDEEDGGRAAAADEADGRGPSTEPPAAAAPGGDEDDLAGDGRGGARGGGGAAARDRPVGRSLHERLHLDDDEVPEEATLEELLQCQVTRTQLEEWVNQPFFERDALNGCVVRMAYGPGVRDNTGATHPGYMVMQIVDIRESGRSYRFGPRGEMTQKHLVLQDGVGITRTMAMANVSSKPFDEAEYERYKRHCNRANRAPITREEAAAAAKKVQQAVNYRWTSADLKAELERKRASRAAPVNAAAEKALLKRRMELAMAQGNTGEALALEEQLAMLENHILTQHANQRSFGMMDINKRNKQHNLNVAYKTTAADEHGGGGGPGGAGDDVFSRRHTTLNIYWNTKGKGGKGDDQDGAGGDEGGRSAGAAAAAKAQALISDKLTKAQQRMDPAELIRQLGLNVDLSLLRSVRAAPSLQQRLLGSKWRAAALAGYQVDLAGKSVLTIADWKRRGGDY